MAVNRVRRRFDIAHALCVQVLVRPIACIRFADARMHGV